MGEMQCTAAILKLKLLFINEETVFTRNDIV